MPKEYEQLASEYNEAGKEAKYFEGALKSAAGEKVAATPEAMKKNAETLKYLRERLQKYKALTEEIKKQGAAFADQSNSANTEMFLDAYNEYLDYLGTQTNVSDEQITTLEDTIDSLEKLQKNETLKSDAENFPIPEEIAKTLKPEDTEKLKQLYFTFILQRVADFKGTDIPESEFSPEKLNEFWHQAAASLNSREADEQTSPENFEIHETAKAKVRIEGPVRKIVANPGWTGFVKSRRRI